MSAGAISLFVRPHLRARREGKEAKQRNNVYLTVSLPSAGSVRSSETLSSNGSTAESPRLTSALRALLVVGVTLPLAEFCGRYCIEDYECVGSVAQNNSFIGRLSNLDC